ncbi:hypothetical protein DOTSEDRAFT_70080 [Dothistroma septosporum NZE10]|uniref:Uncharacterized protein n=1 Tax=Dothistroma septosporum (strain NZE10 / CBS 128990) TaxID=675120 RepID=N1PR85_DOTSN|nr:hypothetical protein DOTSEDRAFT_70080 [Dothistroma septosporum NZE10]
MPSDSRYSRRSHRKGGEVTTRSDIPWVLAPSALPPALILRVLASLRGRRIEMEPQIPLIQKDGHFASASTSLDIEAW